jgi:Glycosyl hydrolase family 53
LSFVTDELSILAQVPDGLGGGLFYWAPDWIPGVPWEPGTGVGSPNTNLTLLNFEGAALPSIGHLPEPGGGLRALLARQLTLRGRRLSRARSAGLGRCQNRGRLTQLGYGNTSLAA